MSTIERLKRFLKLGSLPIEPAGVRSALSRNRDVLDYGDISETPDEILLPKLDRSSIDEADLTPSQLQWRQQGYVILPGFLPDDLVEAYAERRARLAQPGGWKTPTPYLHVPELRALALHPPLMKELQLLIGEDAMLHLALTGWVSTERDWHQDDYLNPAFVNCHYAAVWMALDDIHPDSGPFEFIAGSHKWPLMRGELVRRYMSEEELLDIDAWPSISQTFVASIVEREIARRNAPATKFYAEKGDVLIWHGRLMHRGSAPDTPGMLRKALICHYSGVHHRPDMPHREQNENRQWFARFDHPLE